MWTPDSTTWRTQETARTAGDRRPTTMPPTGLHRTVVLNTAGRRGQRQARLIEARSSGVVGEPTTIGIVGPGLELGAFPRPDVLGNGTGETVPGLWLPHQGGTRPPHRQSANLH